VTTKSAYDTAYYAIPENKAKKMANSTAYYVIPENKVKVASRGAAHRAIPENREKWAARSAAYRAIPGNKEKRAAKVRTPLVRHQMLMSKMRREGVPDTDPLYILENYVEKTEHGCFYSGRALSEASHSLDRINNDLNHTWDNTVACCQELNKVANQHRSYEWKIAEGKKMREFDEYVLLHDYIENAAGVRILNLQIEGEEYGSFR
jgi:hypothetical protein